MSKSLRLYGALLRCYPREFRAEYGDDLIALVEDQLRDEPGPRVWLRTALDLSITVPMTHLEALMSHSAIDHPFPPRRIPSLVAAGFGVVALVCLVSASAIGAPLVLLVGMVAAAVSVGLAVAAWRAGRPVSEVHDVTRAWWRVGAAGLGLAAVVFGLMAVPWPDRFDIGGGLAYYLVVWMLSISAVLVVASALLGVAHLVGRTREERLTRV